MAEELADETPFLRIEGAIDANDSKTLLRLQADFDSLEHEERLKFLENAAIDNQLDIAEALLKMGADLNGARLIIDGRILPGVVLVMAAHSATTDTVRWLLDHGAAVNITEGGVLYPQALWMAIRGDNLDTCKLLIERGALVNAVFEGYNALSVAIEWCRTEIIDYLRSLGAKTPAELEGKPEPKRASNKPAGPVVTSVTQHYKQYFTTPDGPPLMTLQEIVPTDFPIRVHCCRTSERLIIATDGMSARPLRTPRGQESYQYAELMMYLPASWPCDQRALKHNSKYFWPFDWLRRAARYPHEQNTFFGSWTTIANGAPPEPLGPSVGFTSLLVMDEYKEWSRCDLEDGREIVFYLLYPLYTEEREFAMQHKLIDLLTKFAEHELEMTVDPKRGKIC